jgi:hypothetical protein
VATVSAFALIVEPHLGGLGPEGDEPPAHEHDLSLSTVPVQANDWLEGLRRYVVGFAEVWDGGTVHVEVLSDALLV